MRSLSPPRASSPTSRRWSSPAARPSRCPPGSRPRSRSGRHDLLVISDEIYDRLVYGPHQHVCFAALPGMRDRTITLGGFSKDYAMTGWRIGYAAAPAAILAELRKVHQYTIMSAPTMAQAAALGAR